MDCTFCRYVLSNAAQQPKERGAKDLVYSTQLPLVPLVTLVLLGALVALEPLVALPLAGVRVLVGV